MALFLNLYLGHLLGDFLFQPGRLVVAKREGVPGLLTHSMIIGLSTAAVMAGQLVEHWTLIPLAMASHLAIEELTIAMYMKTSARDPFVFVFDQTLHLLSLVLLVVAVDGWVRPVPAVTFGVDLGLQALIQLCGLLTVMLFGSILTFEVSSLKGADEKGRVLALDAPRVAGMAERGGALLAALALGNPLAGLPLFAPRAVCALTTNGRRRSRLLLEGATGLTLCALVWWLVRAAPILRPM